jgi:phenylpropionate dioxygenase-like ring-hydroxylating dioxygenase large terminal subunit
MKAPLDRAAIDRALQPFGWSRMLPREAYVSPEVLGWERRNFFEAAWVCAGRTEDVARPGDHRATRVGGDGILLVRDEAGALRAFHNVCRHRAHELLPAGGCAHGWAIRCPYHGWTYALDGAVRTSGRTGDGPGFDPVAEGLVPARAEEWHGFVFVNGSGDGPPLSEWIGDLDEQVRDHEPERLKVGATHSYEIAANWKLVVENYHECYHCPQIHPQLCKVSPPDSGGNLYRAGAWVGGTMDLVAGAVTMSMDGHSDGVPLRGLSAERRRKVDYWGLFPNFLLSPHPDYVLTHRLEPLAPDRTFIECQWLFPPEALDKPGFDPGYAVEFWDVTNQQDWKAVESCQRGIASRGYRPGTYNSVEDALYQFITRVARGYIEGRFDPAPQAEPAASSR